MTVNSHHSSSSLARYATAKSPGVDLFNSLASKDFCNSFWGLGDNGVHILFARLSGAAKTSDELKNFWQQRALIEEEYSTRLMELAKMTIGVHEIGELRHSVDTLRSATEIIASEHRRCAKQIRSQMEEPMAALLSKQIEHKRYVQAPLEKKWKAKQAQEAYVAKAREKYLNDHQRIVSFSQQLKVNPGRDPERIQMKLERTRQTAQANEHDYANFSLALKEQTVQWETNWKSFCDSCQDMEEDRLEFLKYNIWDYANAVSEMCVEDDKSCESIREALDRMDPINEMDQFVEEYGTGNLVPDPPSFVSYEQQISPVSPVTHVARYKRKSSRPTTLVSEVNLRRDTSSISASARQQSSHQRIASPDTTRRDSIISQSDIVRTPRTEESRAATGTERSGSNAGAPGQGHGSSQPHVTTRDRESNPPTERPPTSSESVVRRRVSGPLPHQPSDQPPSEPIPPVPESSQIRRPGDVLFTVKALYNYEATMDEEFDFQMGDVIAVTATPDDGWWSGVLLDEARREEGRHVFPSNFVALLD